MGETNENEEEHDGGENEPVDVDNMEGVVDDAYAIYSDIGTILCSSNDSYSSRPYTDDVGNMRVYFT